MLRLLPYQTKSTGWPFGKGSRMVEEAVREHEWTDGSIVVGWKDRRSCW